MFEVPFGPGTLMFIRLPLTIDLLPVWILDKNLTLLFNETIYRDIYTNYFFLSECGH